MVNGIFFLCSSTPYHYHSRVRKTLKIKSNDFYHQSENNDIFFILISFMYFYFLPITVEDLSPTGIKIQKAKYR